MEIKNGRYSYRQGKQRRRIRRIVLLVVAVFFTLTVAGYSALALLKPVPAIAAESVKLNTSPKELITEIHWPNDGQAAFGSLNDGVLMTTPKESQKPMASITKLVTALAVLDKLPLNPGETGPLFEIEEIDLNYYRNYVSKFGSVMPINAGQKISELDALKGMLLPSANNIADSLVRWVFGSEAEYLDYANAMLKRIELDEVMVADASGFSPGSKSTPSGLIELGRKVLKNPVLSEIISSRSAVIPGTGEIKNTNMLLNDANSIGIKTGNTDEAGACLLYAYKFGPDLDQTYIGVVMDQPNYYGMFATARNLKDSVLKNYSVIEVLPAGTVVGRMTSSWNQESDIVTSEPLKIYGWPGKTYMVDIVFDSSELPVLKNQVVGKAKLSGMDEYAVNVTTHSPISYPGTIWRLTNYW